MDFAYTFSKNYSFFFFFFFNKDYTFYTKNLSFTMKDTQSFVKIFSNNIFKCNTPKFWVTKEF